MSIPEYCQTALHCHFFLSVMFSCMLGLWVIQTLGNVRGRLTFMVWVSGCTSQWLVTPIIYVSFLPQHIPYASQTVGRRLCGWVGSSAWSQEVGSSGYASPFADSLSWNGLERGSFQGQVESLCKGNSHLGYLVIVITSLNHSLKSSPSSFCSMWRQCLKDPAEVFLLSESSIQPEEPDNKPTNSQIPIKIHEARGKVNKTLRT